MLILSRLSAEVFYSRPLTGCYSVFSLYYYVFNIYISRPQESNLSIYMYSRQFNLYINTIATCFIFVATNVFIISNSLTLVKLNLLTVLLEIILLQLYMIVGPFLLAGIIGLEPTTSWLTANCSTR